MIFYYNMLKVESGKANTFDTLYSKQAPETRTFDFYTL